MTLNETHDPDLESWVESANAPDSDFPIQNLPFCVFRHGGNAPHVGVGIGDQIMDVADAPSLNALMSDGRAAPGLPSDATRNKPRAARRQSESAQASSPPHR